MVPSKANSRSPVLPAGLPEDWVFERDLPCPQCRYNLRMLHLPRCPECGTMFRWQELLHVLCPRCGQSLEAVDGPHCPRCVLELNWDVLLTEATPLPRKLYEYSDRPVRAAMRTSVAVLLPRRFWRRIPLELSPATRRLTLYGRVTWSAGVLGCLIALMFGGATGSLSGWVIACAFALGLPLITRLALPRFTPTLAKFKIRTDQLRRCFVYASTGVAWIGLCFALVLIADRYWLRPPWRWLRWGPHVSVFDFPEAALSLLSSRWAWRRPWLWLDVVVGGVYWLIGFLWWWRFFYVSLRRYLRLNTVDTLALFFSTQTIAVLLILLSVAGSTILAYYLNLL